MIAPEQLADALGRLDPRDRELLSLSLRRRVPDDALARVYEVDPAEVARRRGGAIERLADQLQIRRGEDLGAVLKALLEEDSWAAGGPRDRPGTEFAPRPALSVVQSAAPAASELRVARLTPREEAVTAPVPAKPGFPRLAAALFGAGILALVGAAGLVGATQFGSDGGVSTDDTGGGAVTGGDGTREFVPKEAGPVAAPFPSEPREAPCYSTAYVRRAVTLRRSPGGKRLIRLTAKTEWGSPRVFGVVRRKKDWLAVQAPELRNGAVAWLPASRARLDCTGWSLHADLSSRELVVRRDGRKVREMKIAVGRSGNPTPEGRFSVTDKLRVRDPDSPYGCCVLALTGHQTRLPPGWPGGDRLAVHSTTDLSSIGTPASLGCLRSRPAIARWLIETVPLGAPIFIRA